MFRLENSIEIWEKIDLDHKKYHKKHGKGLFYIHF
jgi:hypothetical protein